MFEICSSQTMQCKKYVNLAQTSVTLADLAVLFRPFDLLVPKDINIIWLPSSLLIMSVTDICYSRNATWTLI